MNDRLIVTVLILHVPGIFSMEGIIRTDETHFNYLVSIWYQCLPLCSGVLIHKRHVLTAAHCLQGMLPEHLSVLVGAGHEERSPESGMKAVQSVWLHPYITTVLKPLRRGHYYLDNDIAVIKLKDSLVQTTTIGFADVVTNGNDWYSYYEFTILGWRHDLIALMEGISFGKARGIIMFEEECLNKKTNLLPNEKCIDAPVVLEHDEGSPVIYNDAVIGIVVSGGLELNEPITVLSIAPYVDFIKSVMRADRTDLYYDEFRYSASIWFLGKLKCGGIIIDSLHIVTSAQCVQNIVPFQLSVVVGKSEVVSYLDINIEWLLVDSIIRHPHFRDYWVGGIEPYHMTLHNIAILKLKRHLVWSTTVGRAPLIGMTGLSSESPYRIIQFETSTIGEIATNIKLKLSSAITQSETYNNLKLLEGQFVLVGADTLPISANHDQGNPVFSHGLVIGMVIQILEDNPEPFYKPTIVLSIHHYADFIQSVIYGS